MPNGTYLKWIENLSCQVFSAASQAAAVLQLKPPITVKIIIRHVPWSNPILSALLNLVGTVNFD